MEKKLKTNIITESLFLRQKNFLNLIYNDRAAQNQLISEHIELAEEICLTMKSDGIPIVGAFMVGESAYLYDIDASKTLNQPILNFPQFIIDDRAIQPRNLANDELSKHLFDIDLSIIVDSDPSLIDWSPYLSKIWRNKFHPFGFETKTIIQHFPDRLGLDIGIYSQSQIFDELARLANQNPDFRKRTACYLIRGVESSNRFVQSNFLNDLITQAIPLWWDSKHVETHQFYWKILCSFYENYEMEDYVRYFFENPDPNNYHMTLFSDHSVLKSLNSRWQAGKTRNLISLMPRSCFQG